MTKEVKREIISRICSIFTTCLFLAIVTWFWFGPRVKMIEAQTGAEKQVASLALLDLNEGIKLENAYPVMDEKGSMVAPYEFQVTNKGNEEAVFTVAFVNDMNQVQKDNCAVLANHYIRYVIEEEDRGYTAPRNLQEDGSMLTTSVAPNATVHFRLKFWIDYEAGNEIMNTHFHGQVQILPAVTQSVLNS